MQEMIEFRKQMDEINDNILNLLAERLEVSKKIGKYKEEDGLPVFDAKREAEIFEKLERDAEEKGLDKKHVLEVFELIIKNSREVQNVD